MPESAIIDSHVHLWDPTRLPLPWLAQVPTLNRPFGLAEFAAATADTPLAGFVFVETDVAPQFALLEAEQMVRLAATNPLLRGIVAAAPLEYGTLCRPYLDALQRLGGPVKGVRRNLQGVTDPQFCLHDDFIAGVRLLADYGWTFDICIRHEQLPAVTELVRRCTQVRFVLDHLGKPPIRQQFLTPWRDDLAALAALPNVWCKVSGMVTEADHQTWQAHDLSQYVQTAITTFGPQRLLFGGDWPVLTLAASYGQWVTTLDALLVGLSPAERQALWGGNAQAAYNLTP